MCDAVIMQCTWRAVIDVCGSCPALLVTGQQSVFNGTTRSLHQSILKTCGDKTKIEFIEVGGVANVLEEKVKLLRCPSFLPVNTSPATAVAKYCDEHVCLSVHEHISGTTRAIFINFSVRVAYGRGSVPSSRVTKSQG